MASISKNYMGKVQQRVKGASFTEKKKKRKENKRRRKQGRGDRK